MVFTKNNAQDIVLQLQSTFHKVSVVKLDLRPNNIAFRRQFVTNLDQFDNRLTNLQKTGPLMNNVILRAEDYC